MEKRVIPVLEMSCAVCAATVEKTVRELTGVEEASVNFSANTLQVVYDPDKISLKDMQAAVSAAGYDLVISENAEADAIDAEHRLYLDLRRRTIGAWSFGLPVMVLSMIFHSPSQILTWILLALTLPVLYWAEFLRAFDFRQLDPTKNWFDVTISHEALKQGFQNYLFTTLPVWHRPHGSRPWKQLKYKNPLKYYWLKYTKGLDKI